MTLAHIVIQLEDGMFFGGYLAETIFEDLQISKDSLEIK